MDQNTYLERFRQVTDYMNDLTARKNRDYAGEANPFQNFNLIEVVTAGRVSTSAGLLVRMADKLQRFANLLAKPPAVADEAIEDTLMDLAVYSIIEYLWLTSRKDTLPLPGIPTGSIEDGALRDTADEEKAAEARDIEAATSYPIGASPNTEQDAYEALADKVEKYGPAALSPSENLLLKMLISARLGGSR